MMKFAAVFILVSSLAALASPLGERTVAQVEAAVAAVNADVKALDIQVTSFLGGLRQALGIHEQAASLVASLVKGTAAVKDTGVVTEAEAGPILENVQRTLPTIIDVLAAIVAKKVLFEKLPLDGARLVKFDLVSLNVSATAFGDALIVVCPAELKAQAIAIKGKISTAFSGAITAYGDV